MQKLLKELFKDKNGAYSLREFIVVLFVAAVMVAWVAEQFFAFPVKDSVFYAFISVVSFGCFGYSIERKTTP